MCYSHQGRDQGGFRNVAVQRVSEISDGLMGLNREVAKKEARGVSGGAP
jgi:hypothetical protein